MVPDTRAAKGPGGVRPLGLPKPIQVRADNRGWPVAVKLGRRWVPVTVEDRWRVDDEWWREDGVARVYFKVSSGNGQGIMIYYEGTTQDWCRQVQ